jgi:nicotinamide-nucleotide amidase
MILQGSRLSQQTSERMRRSRSATDAINLSRLAEEALEAAAQTNASIAIAESCTAGKLAALLSEATGAADRLQGSFVAYTKANKTKSLGVSADLLQHKGAVCREVAIAMAEGALVRSPRTWEWARTSPGGPIMATDTSSPVLRTSGP